MRLKGCSSLASSREFEHAYRKSPKYFTKGFVLFFEPGASKRTGFTVSKKIGNSVQRNRAKRRLRALFITHADRLRDGSYVFVAKNEISALSYHHLEQDFLSAVKKLRAKAD